MTRDEPKPESYEPPSITELGSFVDLTAGGAGGGGDAGTTSEVN
jgi:hypothetical protein